MKRSVYLRALVVALAGLWLAGSLSAQAGLGRGRLNGTVTDPAGHPLAGVKIVLAFDKGGLKLETLSDPQGEWAFLGLGTGKARVLATLAGHVTVMQQVQLKQLEFNPPLRLVLRPVQDPGGMVATTAGKRKNYKLDVELRFWRGGGDPPAGSTVVTATTLTPIFTGRIISARESEREGEELRRVFNLESLALIHRAALAWDSTSGKPLMETIAFDASEYAIDLLPLALNGQFSFRITVTGSRGAGAKQSVLDSEVVLTREQPVVIGFRGSSTGQERFFLSLRLTGATLLPGTPAGDTPRVAAAQRPKKVKHVDPTYPAKALKEKIAGVVVVEARTDEQGKVVAVRVISGHPELDPAAVAAVRQWVYEPFLVNGKATGVLFTVTVAFALNEDKGK